MDENNNNTENTAQVAAPQFAFNTFINLGSIKGESQQDNRKDWIEVLSFGK